MSLEQTPLQRLVSHRLLPADHGAGREGLQGPGDVVRRMGAMQAQDYAQCLWAVGSRSPDCTREAVVAALERGEVVRTWPMRGTIHLVHAADVRWLLALCASKVTGAQRTRLAQLELTDLDVGRAGELVEAAFATGGRRFLERAELMTAFSAGGLDPAGQRGYHLLSTLARAGLVCLGPQQGSAQTFALLRELVPPAALDEIGTEEALARLAHRYVASHGPVTAHDLAKWAGLTVTQARRGLASGWGPPDGPTLVEVGGRWVAESSAGAPTGWREPLLLAGFDEFLLGYKERDEIIEPEHFTRVVPGGNGIFLPMLVEAGKVTGTWRGVSKSRPGIEVTGFAGRPSPQALGPAVERYRAFLGVDDLPVTIT